MQNQQYHAIEGGVEHEGVIASAAVPPTAGPIKAGAKGRKGSAKRKLK